MTDINNTAVAREIAELRAENERLRVGRAEWMGHYQREVNALAERNGQLADAKIENELLRESLKFALCIYRYQLKFYHWRDAKGFLQALRKDENYQSARRILVRQEGQGE